MPSPTRPKRTMTWPPTATSHKRDQRPAFRSSTSSYFTFNEEDINAHPENHYLSPVLPMEVYSDWTWDDDEDEEDAETVEWDAGITDFALFDQDRQAAASRHESLPPRWNGLLSAQASAFERAVQRQHYATEPSDVVRVGSSHSAPDVDELPQLTPDVSPLIKDEDMDSDERHSSDEETVRDGDSSTLEVKSRRANGKDHSRGASGSGFLFPSLTGQSAQHHSREELDYDYDEDDEDDDEDDEEEEDLPVTELIERARLRRAMALKLTRPGLRYGRTLSGKVHVWRRPSQQIYPVGEEDEKESPERTEIQSEDVHET